MKVGDHVTILGGFEDGLQGTIICQPDGRHWRIALDRDESKQIDVHDARVVGDDDTDYHKSRVVP